MSHIAIISGGHRPNGNSPRIARTIAEKLTGQGHTTYTLDLAQTELPFWDEGMWGQEPLAAKWTKLWQPVADELTRADAFVIVCPEYHGMVSSHLVNFFLLLGNGPIAAHKPALAVTVSSSVGGAYPMAELRGFSAKNNRMVYMPEHLIIRSADNMLQAETKPEHEAANNLTTKRLDWLLGMLSNYATAFATIRAVTQTAHPKFANGM